MNKIITVLLGLLLVLALPACGKWSKEDSLDISLRSYEKMMRWGDISKVNNFRRSPVALSEQELKKLKFIKVTGYQTHDVLVESDDKMKVRVSIRYYHEQYAQVKTIEDNQYWEYDNDKERWFITSPLPNF